MGGDSRTPPLPRRERIYIYIKDVGWETVSAGENNVILYHEGSMKKVDEGGGGKKDNV